MASLTQQVHLYRYSKYMLGSETLHSVITQSKNSGEEGVVEGTRANKSSKCPTNDSQ